MYIVCLYTDMSTVCAVLHKFSSGDQNTIISPLSTEVIEVIKHMIFLKLQLIIIKIIKTQFTIMSNRETV